MGVQTAAVRCWQGLLNNGDGCLTTHLSDIGLFIDGRPVNVLEVRETRESQGSLHLHWRNIRPGSKTGSESIPILMSRHSALLFQLGTLKRSGWHGIQVDRAVSYYIDEAESFRTKQRFFWERADVRGRNLCWRCLDAIVAQVIDVGTNYSQMAILGFVLILGTFCALPDT